MAIRICPIESSATTPSKTAKPLGGTIIANPPLPRIGPRDMGFPYPRFSISGTKEEPSSATLPILLPVRAAKSTPPPTANRANLPFKLPNHLSSASRRFTPIPEWNIISPITRNKATGTKVNVLRESEIWMTSWNIPGKPPKKK